MVFKEGYMPWNKGKKMEDKIRDKIRNTLKGIKPKNFDEMRKKGGFQNMKYKKDKHWHWKGGITPLHVKLRSSSLYKIWREAVFLRDNFTCQNPNCEYCHSKMGVMLHAHHIKPFALFPELRFDVRNGITYCAEYHLNTKLIHESIRGGQ
jgi:hypothetical protein